MVKEKVATHSATLIFGVAKILLMAKDKSTVRFWLRTDKTTQDGTAPIFIIYSVKGQRAYYNSSKKIHPVQWDSDTKQVIYRDKKTAAQLYPEAKELQLLSARDVNNLNAELIKLTKTISEIEQRFRLDGIPFSSQMVIERLNILVRPETIKEKPKNNVAEWIVWYETQCTNTHKAGTRKCYTGLANHIKAFEQKTKQKVSFEALNLMVLSEFRDFLTHTQKHNNTTVAKWISTLTTLLDKARVSYKVPVNIEYKDFKNYGREDAEYEVIVLTEDEFEAMRAIDLSTNERLDKQRDVFLFAAATGLRYSDLVDLRRIHLKEGWIKKTCVKTEKPLSIPINPLARQILDKYSDLVEPLPMVSNDKCRKYIKEVAKKCSIDEPIEQIRRFGKKEKAEVYPKHELVGIHTGRKTFVTMMLNKGVAPQDVMAITDHRSWRSFQRYVNVADKQKLLAMDKGFGSFENKNADVTTTLTND